MRKISISTTYKGTNLTGKLNLHRLSAQIVRSKIVCSPHPDVLISALSHTQTHAQKPPPAMENDPKFPITIAAAPSATNPKFHGLSAADAVPRSAAQP
jgi:hypothetical protein